MYEYVWYVSPFSVYGYRNITRSLSIISITIDWPKFVDRVSNLILGWFELSIILNNVMIGYPIPISNTW